MDNSVKHGLLFTILLVLSGCATYHPQPIKPVALITTFEARTLDNPDLRRYLAAHCGDAQTCASGIWT